MGEEPPLSPGKALKIAKYWITGGKDYHVWVMDISITPFGATSGKGIYYYNILFGGASYVGHLNRCIILMDGTIIQPELLGVRKSYHYDPWSFDE